MSTNSEPVASEETRFQLQRDRMLKAAAHCFNQKGFSGTSLKDVAARLGLTAQSSQAPPVAWVNHWVLLHENSDPSFK